MRVEQRQRRNSALLGSSRAVEVALIVEMSALEHHLFPPERPPILGLLRCAAEKVLVTCFTYMPNVSGNVPLMTRFCNTSACATSLHFYIYVVTT